MGSRYTRSLPGGLLIPERCVASTLAAVVSPPTDTDSSYTEAGPRPGKPIAADALSRLRLEIAHAQESDIDLRAIKAGNPARDGVQVAYKIQGEANSLYRGWDGPQLATGFAAIDWSNGSVNYGVAVMPKSQRVIVAYVGTNPVDVARLDRDESVTLNTSTGITTGTDWNRPALVVLPDETRLLCFHGGNAWYSDDEGDTWAAYANNITSETTTDYGRTVAVVYRGDILMLVEDSATADTVHHLVSTDLGASFRLVKSYTGLGQGVNMVANEDGIHVVFNLTSATASRYRRLGTVFDEIDGITATDIATGANHERVTIVADGGGTLYALSGASAMNVYESRDTGESWTVSASESVRFGDNADDLANLRSVYANGRLCLIATFVNSGTPLANRLAAHWFGGWSNIPVYVIDDADALTHQRWGWGQRVGSTNADGETYWPWTVPSGQNWTAAGTGVETLNNEGSYAISTTADTLSNTINVTADTALVMWRVYVNAGGSGDLSTDDVAFRVRVADGTNDADVSVRFNDTQFAVWDNNAGSSLLGATNMASTTFTDFMLYLDNNAGTHTLKLAHRAVGDTAWTLDITAGVPTDDAATPGANTEIQFGNLATGTSDSRWQMVHYASATAKAADFSISPSTHVGKSLNARSEPLPDVGGTDKVAFIRAVAGPARRADTQSVDVFYEHAIDAAHAEVSPSPRATWRSSDLTKQLIVYDLGDTGWTGHSIALFVANANFRTAYLESYNGATWDTVATLDLATGFTGLDYTLNGDIMYPNTATTSAGARYLWEQELRNGWVQATGGGSTASSRILAQSQGGWTTGTTVVPMLELDDTSAISGLSTPTVSLVWSTGLVVAHHTAIGSGLKRYWRVRIAAGTAGEDTPIGESYYEAGIIAVCRVQPFGAEIEWGMGDRGQLNVQSRTDSAGVTRVRERGPATHDWSISWPNMEHWRKPRVQVDLDYHGISGGLGLAGQEDVSEAIRGYIQLLASGETPVIGVEPIPETTGTVLTDRTRFRYGRLVNTASRARAGGAFASEDERNRVETIRIEEIP